MPNYLLCDQFHVKVSVFQFNQYLVRLAVTTRNPGSKVNGMYVLCFVLDCYLNLALCFRNRLRSSGSHNCIREKDNKIVVLLRVNRRVSLQFYVGYWG